MNCDYIILSWVFVCYRRVGVTTEWAWLIWPYKYKFASYGPVVTVVDCVLHTLTGEEWKHQLLQGRGEEVGGHVPTTEAAAVGTRTRRRLVIQCLKDCMVYKTYTCGYFSY